MKKQIIDIYFIASKINDSNEDELDDLIIEFNQAIKQFLKESGDGITSLYSFEYTTKIQQQIIDDAITKILKYLVKKYEIDESLLDEIIPKEG